MRIKTLFQIVLLLIIFTILVFFYYQYILDKNQKLSENITEDQKDNINFNEKIVNELVNVEYNSSDKNGNTFYLNAEKAVVELEENANNNKVKLDKVVSVVTLKNRGIIYIYSNNAIYDKLTHDTFFFNNVKIDYLNNSIFSGNLDLIFTEKICKIYNDVMYKNEKLYLNTDKILIDIDTGDIRLEMLNKNEKVKLVTKYEYIN